MALTVDSMAQLHRHNEHVRYVVVFQNWLKPAGASFDHLHKQVVAIDEVGADNESVLPKLSSTRAFFLIGGDPTLR
ncbi:hypothetical protein JCM18918_4013 [Cutibacterium acnes JCM 18918]|nr:hypothetical protein JCM18918_4013 [Cutibacterium acnes JCM 18918]